MPTEDDKTIDKIFEEINNIKNAQTAFSGKVDQVVEFKDMVHKIIFGNGRDGLLTKVSKCFHMQTLQWSLFVVFLIAILGLAMRVFQAGG